MSKWGGRPHWEFGAVLLGSDHHGHWLGVPAGTRHARPGAEFVSDVPTVTLAPHQGWFLATWHGAGHAWCDTYVDITTPGALDASGDAFILRAVDLDLDVVRDVDGRVWIDDEDEFEEHRTTYAYPDEVVSAARRACADVHAVMLSAANPFDGSHLPWLSMAAAL